MKRYIARAPVTVVCDRRPGDSFEAEPADVAHLVDAGHVELLGAQDAPPVKQPKGATEGAKAPTVAPAGAPTGSGAKGPTKKSAAKKTAPKKPAK